MKSCNFALLFTKRIHVNKFLLFKDKMQISKRKLCSDGPCANLTLSTANSVSLLDRCLDFQISG